MTSTATTLDEILGQIFDTRDLIELVTTLEAVDADDEDYEEAQAELARIVPFAEEIEQYATDYRYGEGVVREDYFVEYAQELADDIGAINSKEQSWPLGFIDWDAAADALKADYTEIEFEGVTWYVRS